MRHLLFRRSYDLPALFVGSRRHPELSPRWICGCTTPARIEVSSRVRVRREATARRCAVECSDVEGIATLELIDGRAAALAREHLGVRPSVELTVVAIGGTGRRPRSNRPARHLLGTVHGVCGSPRSVWMPLRSTVVAHRESLPSEVLGCVRPASVIQASRCHCRRSAASPEIRSRWFTDVSRILQRRCHSHR